MVEKYLSHISGNIQEVIFVLGFIKAIIDASHDADFGYSYDLDLAEASANVESLLPDSALNPGKRVAFKITSFSATYSWSLMTTGGQNIDEYSSGDITTLGLPEYNALYYFIEVEAKADGSGWNIVQKYSR